LFYARFRFKNKFRFLSRKRYFFRKNFSTKFVFKYKNFLANCYLLGSYKKNFKFIKNSFNLLNLRVKYFRFFKNFLKKKLKKKKKFFKRIKLSLD
jgi:hypothetical protein